jgi:heat shock protein HslJ
MSKLYAISILLALACGTQKKATDGGQSITGIEWKLKNMNSTDYKWLNPPVTLKLNESENSVSGFAGCNRYFGKADIQEKHVKFGELGTTRMFCQYNMEVEDSFLKRLQEVNTYRVNGVTLQLLVQDSVVLEFEK